MNIFPNNSTRIIIHVDKYYYIHGFELLISFLYFLIYEFIFNEKLQVFCF